MKVITGLAELRASVPTYELALEWQGIALRVDNDANASLEVVEHGLVQAADRVLKAHQNEVEALFGDEPTNIERWMDWCDALETALIKVLRRVVAGLPDERKPAALDAHRRRFQGYKLVQQWHEFYPWDRALAEAERLYSVDEEEINAEQGEARRPHGFIARNAEWIHDEVTKRVGEALPIERRMTISDACKEVAKEFERVHGYHASPKSIETYFYKWPTLHRRDNLRSSNLGRF